jgi:PncC family amidohydrolase
MRSLEEQLIEKLIQKNKTIATVESLTGGMVSAALVNVSGASAVFNQGLVTYSNEAKHRLTGVPWELLEAYGAVSAQVAAAMAEGGAKSASAEICLSTTGIAGPTGGTPEKPVGLVYIGCFLDGVCHTKECHFTGTREEVREQTVQAVLELALEWLE